MNRSPTGAFVNHALVYALVALGASTSIGLGMVWMRQQISIEANSDKAVESRIADVERRIEEQTAAIAAEKDPAVLMQRNTEWQLGLAPPSEDRVERVDVDPMLRLAQKRDRNLFGEGRESVSIRVAAQP